MDILANVLSHIRQNSKHDLSPSKTKSQTWELNSVEMQWLPWSFFRERRSSFSLEIEAIGPLDFDGARREVVLRGAGYA